MRIKKNTLEFILGVSRKIYPNEFAGLLRGNPDLITEVLVIPASTWGKGFAITRFDMIPIDHSIIGSVHSHPNNFKPSDTDLRYFKRIGFAHLIVKFPYQSIDDIAAYDRYGEKIELEVTN